METKWNKDKILSKLWNKIRNKKPLLFASADTGIAAKLLEKAGFDCINTFSGGLLRRNGFGTMAMLWPILNSNEAVVNFTEQEILTSINGSIFICVFINANDPFKDMYCLLKHLKSIGIHCISHVPSISDHDKNSHIYQVLTQSGITLNNEIELLKLASDLEFVTVATGYNIEDGLRIVRESNPSIYCCHAGTTGLDSFKDTLEAAAKDIKTQIEELKKIKPDLIIIAHSASVLTPEQGQFLLDNTGAHGLWTGSVTERIPIEKSVSKTAQEFANLKFVK
jgi:predicted TIM-barrel enzyme